MGFGPFRVGTGELLIILVVVLLIFGPKNLPKLGSALGKTVKSLRDGMGGGKKDAVEETDAEETVVEPVEEEAPAKKTTTKAEAAPKSKSD